MMPAGKYRLNVSNSAQSSPWSGLSFNGAGGSSPSSVNLRGYQQPLGPTYPGLASIGDRWISATHRADARNLIEPPARLIRSVPGHDLPVEAQDLSF